MKWPLIRSRLTDELKASIERMSNCFPEIGREVEVGTVFVRAVRFGQSGSIPDSKSTIRIFERALLTAHELNEHHGCHYTGHAGCSFQVQFFGEALRALSVLKYAIQLKDLMLGDPQANGDYGVAIGIAVGTAVCSEFQYGNSSVLAVVGESTRNAEILCGLAGRGEVVVQKALIDLVAFDMDEAKPIEIDGEPAGYIITKCKLLNLV